MLLTGLFYNTIITSSTIHFGVSQPILDSGLNDLNSWGGANMMWFSVACGEVPAWLRVHVWVMGHCRGYLLLGLAGCVHFTFQLAMSGACLSGRDIQLMAVVCFSLSAGCLVCPFGGWGAYSTGHS